MALGNIFRTVCILDLPNSVEATINKYIQASSTIPAVDYAAVVTEVATWYDDMLGDMESSIGEATTSPGIVVYHVDDATGDETVLDTAAITFNPAATGGVLPLGVAALLSAQVFQDRGVIKYFFPAIADNLIDADGDFTATVLTDLALAGVEMLVGPNAVNGINFATGSWNRSTLTFKDVGSSAVAHATPAYQRRRKPGVGS